MATPGAPSLRVNVLRIPNDAGFISQSIGFIEAFPREVSIVASDMSMGCRFTVRLGALNQETR